MFQWPLSLGGRPKPRATAKLPRHSAPPSSVRVQHRHDVNGHFFEDSMTLSIMY